MLRRYRLRHDDHDAGNRSETVSLQRIKGVPNFLLKVSKTKAEVIAPIFYHRRQRIHARPPGISCGVPRPGLRAQNGPCVSPYL